ncbi:MobQ family relaxase [Sphingobium lactosutens]|uniref:MobQ family relaxase n=1 Tax=Sphingobium lactosutens TaxID=522773 RepID=UPI0021191460|nr:MobQ family relaxase [Sphingobium lactosutens]
MAIFHFSVQVISRASGRSAVSAAAYRAGERLHDERLDRDHDFRARSGVEHSEIMLPESAPDQWRDRARLWNDVEAFEKRRDAQLGREVEFAIPREMTKPQGIELARDFVQAEFVDRGMIADLNVHWDMGSDGQPAPHAHVMLTMREVGPDGFGSKVREWNAQANVEQWRERWADHVNQRLAELDIDARIDHRSLESQGIDLEPQSKIGGPAHRMEAHGLDADRAEMHREIAKANGERIIANPGIALDAITHSQATFTRRDLAIFLHRHSAGQEQFNAATHAVRNSADLIPLIGTVHTRQQQRLHLLYCGIGTALAISLLWLVYPGWGASIGPRDWLWPERTARRTLGEESLWSAGIRLMRAGNPTGWQMIIEAADMRKGNLTAINACEKAAAKARKPLNCTIRIGSTEW